MKPNKRFVDCNQRLSREDLLKFTKQANPTSSKKSLPTGMVRIITASPSVFSYLSRCFLV